MYIDDKEFQRKLNEAECAGVDRARNTIVFIYKHWASIEKDPVKKQFYADEAARLSDDNLWNLLER